VLCALPSFLGAYYVFGYRFLALGDVLGIIFLFTSLLVARPSGIA
jgi:hypothetical protein